MLQCYFCIYKKKKKGTSILVGLAYKKCVNNYLPML